MVWLLTTFLQASEIGKAFVRVFDKSGPERAPQCFGFTLSNEAISQYEKENPPPGAEDTPYSIQVTILGYCT